MCDVYVYDEQIHQLVMMHHLYDVYDDVLNVDDIIFDGIVLVLGRSQFTEGAKFSL